MSSVALLRSCPAQRCYTLEEDGKCCSGFLPVTVQTVICSPFSPPVSPVSPPVCLSSSCLSLLLQLQSSVTEFEFSQEEYRQLQVEFWSRFYACCLQYQEALSLPLGLTVSQSTGMVCLLKTVSVPLSDTYGHTCGDGPLKSLNLFNAGVFQGFVSFLLPCFAVDHLYLSYDEYLFSEDETPIAEGDHAVM